MLKVCCGLVAEVYATGLKPRPRSRLARTVCSTRRRRAAKSSPSVQVPRSRASSPVASRRRLASCGRLDALRLGAGLGHRLTVAGSGLSPGRRSSTQLPFDRHQQDTSRSAPTAASTSAAARPATSAPEGPPQRRDPLLQARRQRPADRRARPPQPVRARLRRRHALYPDNARDDLGENEPAETIVRIRPAPTTAGRGAGQAGRSGSCRARARARHRSPTSSRTRRRIARLWAGTMIVAEWGQYLSKRSGRKLVQVTLGPATPRRSPTARAPLGLTVEPHGGVLAGDWGHGVIYGSGSAESRARARPRPSPDSPPGAGTTTRSGST